MARYKAKASKSAVTFVGIMAFLAVVGVLAIALGLASNWSYWIPKKYLPTVNGDKNDVVAVAPASNMSIEQTENDGIRLLSAPMALSDFEAYDVSPYADSVQTVTATLSPTDTTLQKVDFTGDWANPNSTWASGKNFSDYVQITQATDGALTCAVSALQPFGEPGIITCTARALEEGDYVPSATCTVDYYRRHTNCTVTFHGEFIDHDEEEGDFTHFQYEYSTEDVFKYADEQVTQGNYDDSTLVNKFYVSQKTSIGTITDDINKSTVNVTVKISDSVAAKMKSAAGVSTLKTYTLVTNGNFTGCLMKTAIDTILGGAANVNSHKVAIYNAFKEIYDSNQAALTFEVNYTTSLMKINYTFNLSSIFNPLALGVKASGVGLDKPGVILSLPIFTNDYALPEQAA